MARSNHSTKPSRSPSQRQPTIYIRTLGIFAVLRHGIQVVWQGGTAGARQLPRAFAYLVLRRGQAVQRNELARAAGGHEHHYGDRRYVVTDLLRKLKVWGLEAALHQHKPGISLEPDALWRTDTDDLTALIEGAQTLEAGGQPTQAITLLEQATALCGGDYLPIFEPGFDPRLDSERPHWNNMQKQAHRALTRLHMAMPGEQHHTRAARIAGIAIRFDRNNPDSYRFAAAAARHAGDEAAARYFEQLARDLQSRPGHDP